MSQLDQTSQALGRLQGQMETVLENQRATAEKLDSLLAFKWRAVGIGTVIAAMVESAHVWLTPGKHP